MPFFWEWGGKSFFHFPLGWICWCIATCVSPLPLPWSPLFARNCCVSSAFPTTTKHEASSQPTVNHHRRSAFEIGYLLFVGLDDKAESYLFVMVAIYRLVIDVNGRHRGCLSILEFLRFLRSILPFFLSFAFARTLAVNSFAEMPS